MNKNLQMLRIGTKLIPSKIKKIEQYYVDIFKTKYIYFVAVPKNSLLQTSLKFSYLYEKF